MHACSWVCMYACMHVIMNVYIYVCVCVHTRTARMAAACWRGVAASTHAYTRPRVGAWSRSSNCRTIDPWKVSGSGYRCVICVALRGACSFSGCPGGASIRVRVTCACMCLLPRNVLLNAMVTVSTVFIHAAMYASMYMCLYLSSRACMLPMYVLL